MHSHQAKAEEENVKLYTPPKQIENIFKHQYEEQERLKWLWERFHIKPIKVRNKDGSLYF